MLKSSSQVCYNRIRNVSWGASLKGEIKSNFWEGLGLINETLMLSHFLISRTH